MNRAVLLVSVAAVGLACAPLWAGEKWRVPKYEGKPLGYWVERLQKSETHEQRNLAAVAIMAFEADAAPAIPLLVEMLDDCSDDYRGFAKLALGTIGKTAKPVVPTLLGLLREKSARYPAEVIDCLGQIGPPAAEAVPTLTAALKDKALSTTALRVIHGIS